MIGESATDQCQCCKGQHVAVEDPLHGGEVGAEKSPQLGQRNGQCRAVDEGHRGGEHTGREHDPATLRINLSPQLTRARLGSNDAAVAWLDEWLRHACIMDCRGRPGNDVAERAFALS